MKSFFAECGEVANIRILDVRPGKVTTLGFVTFATSEGAQKAISVKNNAEFNGSPLRVTDDGPRQEGGGAAGGSNFQVKVFYYEKNESETE